jgi:aryl-alcohol dehydrogenase-like predicted oxidoreductase
VSDKRGLVSYASLQLHYNLVHREEFERGLADVVQAYGLGVIPYSPLAGGFLTGKYQQRRQLPESARAQGIHERLFMARNFELLAAMEGIAQARGRDVQEVALAWLLGNPLVAAPIVGANSVEQLQGSLSAVGFRLSEAEMETLYDLSSWREA